MCVYMYPFVSWGLVRRLQISEADFLLKRDLNATPLDIWIFLRLIVRTQLLSIKRSAWAPF